MPAGKIILPAFLVADLYKNNLVNVREFPGETLASIAPPPSTGENDDKKIRFLGQNNKHVVVLLKDQEAPFINDTELAFLAKILKACQLNLSDIAVVNLYNKTIDATALAEQFAPKFVLMFDVDPSAVGLPFTIPQFQVQQFDGCTYFTCPPLRLMITDTADSKVLKTKLWLTLQKAFNL